MATTNTFDYGWDGISEPETVPSGTDLGLFDYSWDGGTALAAEEVAATNRRRRFLLGACG